MRSLLFVIFSRLVLIFLVTFLLLAVLLMNVMERSLVASTYEDAEITLGFIARNLEANYQRQLQSLEHFVYGNSETLASPESAGKAFAAFLSFDNIYNSIHYYRADGTLLVAERRTGVPAYKQEKNFHERKGSSFVSLAERVLRTGEPAAGEVEYTSEGKPYQVYVVPHKRGNRVRGIVSGGIYLAEAQMGYLLGGLSSSSRHLFLLSDGRGRVIFRSAGTGVDDRAELQAYLNLAAEKLQEQPLVSSRDLFTGSLPYLISSVRLSSLQFVVTYGVAREFLWQRERELRSLFAFGLILCLFVAFLFAFFLSRRISSPLDAAIEQVRRLQIGDFSARISGKDAQLFPDLSEGLNEIAQKLEKDRALGEIWCGDAELRRYLEGK